VTANDAYQMTWCGIDELCSICDWYKDCAPSRELTATSDSFLSIHNDSVRNTKALD
jgi:hypothetical protein